MNKFIAAVDRAGAWGVPLRELARSNITIRCAPTKTLQANWPPTAEREGENSEKSPSDGTQMES